MLIAMTTRKWALLMGFISMLALSGCDQKGACEIDGGSLGKSCTEGSKSICPEAATNKWHKDTTCNMLGYGKKEGDHFVK